MKNLRYDFIITFIVGSFIMLSAMWPALLATLLLFTAIVILKDACGEGCKYFATKTILFFFALCVTIVFGMVLAVYPCGILKTEVTKLQDIMYFVAENIKKGHIFSNFKIYITDCMFALPLYAIVASATLTLYAFIVEHRDEKNKCKNVDTIPTNRERKQISVKRSNPFKIFLIRPRLILLLLANYFVFWFNNNFSIVGNTVMAGIFLGVVMLSLSDVFEYVMRSLEDVRHIATYTEKERLTEIFDYVKKRAMKFSENIDGKVKLYIVDTPSINAFAIGQHTIAVTRGLMLAMNDEELEAVIAHEMGHIINGDGQVAILVSLASNIYLWSILIATKILHLLETLLGNNSFFGSLIGFIRKIVEIGRNYAITLLTVLVSSTSRREEFKADKIAYELGYGEALLSALYKLYDMEMSDRKKLIDKLKSTHPKTAFRIERLEKMYETEETAEAEEAEKAVA